MPRVLVANELSFVAAEDRRVARERLSGFIKTIVAAVGAGAERGLRSAVSLDGLALAPDYVLAQWRNDDAVDRESRRYMRTLQINTPPILLTDGAEVADREGRTEYRYQGELATGLGAAALLHGLAISLASSTKPASSQYRT